MLCFVGVSVQLVSRFDVITAQSLGYLLMERDRKRKGGGGVGQEKKTRIKVGVILQLTSVVFPCTP